MFLHFTAAFCLGSLIGLMVGMSASPVVSSMLGALTVVAIALLGIRQANTEAVHSRVTLIRTIGLSLGCILCLFAGLSLRGSDYFGSSLKSEMSAWTAIGFSDEQARAVLLFNKCGLLPGPSNSFVVAGAGSERKSDHPAPGVLYGSADPAVCGELDPDRYKDPDEMLNAFKLAKGNWAEIAKTVESLPKEHRLAMLRLAWRLQCEKSK